MEIGIGPIRNGDNGQHGSYVLSNFPDNSPHVLERSSREPESPLQRHAATTLLCFGILIESLERHESITGWALWIDNFAAALLLGLVVFLYERRRERELVGRLRVIELMNHHVRNALQPIMYVPYSQDQQQQLNTIRDAVNRIDWALREILPGTSQNDSSPPRQNAA